MPSDHIADRDVVLRFLRAELLGPSPAGSPIDCDQEISLSEAEEAFRPRVQAGTGEEILPRDPPGRRYGIGVLFPLEVPADDEEPETEGALVPPELDEPALLGDGVDKQLEALASRPLRTLDAEEEFDLSGTNEYRQSSMALSFLADLGGEAALEISITAGRYRPKKVMVLGRERVWWLRRSLSSIVTFPSEILCGHGNVTPSKPASGDGFEGLDIRVELLSRPHGSSDTRLITVCLVNRTSSKRPVDECSLFQVGFSVKVTSAGQRGRILPYPRHPEDLMDEEEQALDLLYREVPTFAVGHGCAADWDAPEGSVVATVHAVPLPTFETPSITPEIVTENGSQLEVPMGALAAIDKVEAGRRSLQQVVEAYEDWIRREEVGAGSLEARYLPAARKHIALCRIASARMRDGIQLLDTDPVAARAFQLANLAVLTQQVNGARQPRDASLQQKTRKNVFTPEYLPPDLVNLPAGAGRWRPFQIAFLLMSLRAITESASSDRRTVDLLWFPTGGGKTEAYLGLAAYSLFLRRLRDPEDVGTDVLMRYTLRLLTAQQFQRAARLICAMEILRREQVTDLGEAPFSIGIWLGGSTTPNTRNEAVSTLRALQHGEPYVENKFLLDRCPWCKAPMGPRTLRGEGKKHEQRILGMEQRGNSVGFHCPDARCPFGSDLPISVVDEDIYDAPPSFIIGTIDKFAVLAWKPEARGLFGINADGHRVVGPPSLIIQDELHLISGPLGSMAGLFEALVEDLCTDRRQEPVLPKIVCSTATIRRYREQVRALYRREDAMLFPPPCTRASDSFFARYARNANGTLRPGRMYVGVHAPALGSLQTAQVRTLCALLQAPMQFDREGRDPWWTLMVFFNSLRELGGTLSLIQSDIPDYLKVIRQRLGIAREDTRWVNDVLELTGRLQSDDVPKAIARLETPTTREGYPVDVCLASSIIEVGMDIDRLSVMAVVGQPKTTAQYIQATGRIGRRWWERPGLVTTIYAASKARDRSHYEKFRSYHERLYSQVEPTSVTPFSRPVLERALHAVMAGYARQMGDRGVSSSPRPLPMDLMLSLKALLKERSDFIDPAESQTLEEVFERRVAEWREWEPRFWTDQGEYEAPLLRYPGVYEDPVRAQRSWSTPTSMRNVDLECQAEISPLYVNAGEKPLGE